MAATASTRTAPLALTKGRGDLEEQTMGVLCLPRS